jgi:hypothetical protein
MVSSRTLTGGRLRLAVPNSSPIRMVGPRCGDGDAGTGASGVWGGTGVSLGISFPPLEPILRGWPIAALDFKSGLGVLVRQVLSRELGYDFQIAVTAVPDLLSRDARHNDAALGGSAGCGDRVAVHEKATAAEGVGAGVRCQRQHIRTVFRGIHRRSADGPVTLRNWADVLDGLHRGIVLALVSPGVSGGDKIAILQKVARFLRVCPHIEPQRSSALDSATLHRIMIHGPCSG